MMFQVNVGDEVFLMNPRAVRQKVAVGTISGLLGEHQFHFKAIPESWLKVDVRDILIADVALMYPNEAADMTHIQHAKGSSVIWGQQYVKPA
jgi:hypothetical protein